MASIPLDMPPAGQTPSRKGLLRPFDREEWRQFVNWVLVWIVLANIGFASMWLIGAPPRRPEIYAAAAIGLMVRRAPIWVRCLAFAGTLIYSLLGFIAGLFNLSIVSLLHSLKFFAEINPANSWEYIGGGALLAGIFVFSLWAMRRPQGFSEVRLLILALLAALTLAQVDRFMGQGMRGHYKRAAEVGTPFVSASDLTGFGTVAPGAAKRNFMMVVVESLGDPANNEEMKRLLFARYHSPEVAARYELSTGTTTYYNSTTAGEMRELCGRWGDYYEVLEDSDSGCLPARLGKQGYETRAYHSFTGAFFERESWYPHIGFQQQEFAQQLFQRGARECGGVFPGVCDADVPALLAQDLKAAEKPQFVYWLTLNSHLPVPPGMNLDVDNCDRVSTKLAADFPMICRQFALWDQLDTALVREITAADFPETDILIVGDHMPPYYDRHHRSQFAPDRVPYLMLRWKGDAQENGNVSAIVDAGAKTAGGDG